MMRVEVFRDWPKYMTEPVEAAEVEVGPVEFGLQAQFDLLDPMRRLQIAYLRVGKRFGAKVVVENNRPTIWPLMQAAAALFAFAVENAAEIRDAIALEKADASHDRRVE